MYQERNVSKKLRLVNGYRSSEGRVEIRIGGKWNTVCNLGWNVDIANTVCNILGFGGAMETFHHAYFGKGRGLIRVVNVECLLSTTPTFTSCVLSSGVNNTCSHVNDVGVICFRKSINNYRFSGVANWRCGATSGWSCMGTKHVKKKPLSR